MSVLGLADAEPHRSGKPYMSSMVRNTLYVIDVLTVLSGFHHRLQKKGSRGCRVSESIQKTNRRAVPF